MFSYISILSSILQQIPPFYTPWKLKKTIGVVLVFLLLILNIFSHLVLVSLLLTLSR